MRRDFFYTLILVSTLLFSLSCKNDLLPQPSEGLVSANTQSSMQTSWGAPVGLSATQGIKREITLSWTPVKNAVRYFIFKANSPYDTFVQIGETEDSSPTYTMQVPSGTDAYYKITAVDYEGNQSPYSSIVRATSLAQPTISEIAQDNHNPDSQVIVYWYMSNVDAYQKYVRYSVICSDSKGTEVARLTVDGSQTNSTVASFSSLTPNTDYNYTVESYLISDQNSTEKSIPLSAQTARRLRPNQPENLQATKSVSLTEIELTFTLPDLVDVAVSSGVYEQKPLYFKIYRRAKASENGSESEYLPICTYFGKAKEDESSGKKNFGSEEYTPGTQVTYVDTADLTRGVEYEYKVQGFADDIAREISSDLSSAETNGYLIYPMHLKTENYNATLNSDETKYVSASLGFHIDWNDMGSEELYDFILEERKYSATESSGSTDSIETNNYKFDNTEELNQYVREFDLSDPASASGYFRYAVYMVKAGQEDTSTYLDKVYAIGQILVTDSIELPSVKYFAVRSGYGDKIVIEWDYDDTYSYNLKYWEGTNTSEDSVIEVDQDLLYQTLDNKSTGDIISFEHEAEPNTTRTYILYATTAVTSNTNALVGSSLAMPEPKVDGYHYSDLNIKWSPISNATSYTLAAKYQDANIDKNNKISSSEELSGDITNYSFTSVAGSNNPKISGLPINVSLTVNSQITKTYIRFEDENYTEPVTEEIEDESSSLTGQLTTHNIGPALIQAVAEKSVSSDSIFLTWNKTEGASAYMVIRNRYNIKTGGSLEYNSTDKYVISTENGLSSSLAGGIEEVGSSVTVSYSPQGQIILNDKYKAQTDKTSSWQLSQSQIPWGAPYDYIVLPLVSSSDTVDYDYQTSPTNATIASANYINLSSTRGSALGYAWNVTASKGWETATLNGGASSAENASIFVTWDNPALDSDVTPSYQIYRRKEGTPSWELQNTIDTNFYQDTNIERGTVYEYAIGLVTTNLQTSPNKDAAYIAYTDQIKDATFSTEKAASGFVLPQPTITSISRDQRSNANGYTELVKWPAAYVNGKANRMINGYVIEVLNPNISDAWNTIADIPLSQENSSNLYEYEVDNSNGLLKVLRDYKHYFRIRAYREQNGKRTYSSVPDYTYSNGAENTYVKWGARQITIDEFALVAATSIGDSLYNDTYSSVKEGNVGYDRTYTFKTPGPSFQNISGNLYGYATATGSKPQKYGAVCAGIWGALSGSETKTSTLTFTENTGVGMYSGTVVIENLDSSSGTFRVTYNEQTKECYTQDIGKLFKY
ncbi:MAG: hypothetical protein J6B81_02825 [Spirochaetaceae bacterium]|nr:hypothetical protein [Spirochaetaceae bacterium]